MKKMHPIKIMLRIITIVMAILAFGSLFTISKSHFLYNFYVSLVIFLILAAIHQMEEKNGPVYLNYFNSVGLTLVSAGGLVLFLTVCLTLLPHVPATPPLDMAASFLTLLVCLFPWSLVTVFMTQNFHLKQPLRPHEKKPAAEKEAGEQPVFENIVSEQGNEMPIPCGEAADYPATQRKGQRARIDNMLSYALSSDLMKFLIIVPVIYVSLLPDSPDLNFLQLQNHDSAMLAGLVSSFLSMILLTGAASKPDPRFIIRKRIWAFCLLGLVLTPILVKVTDLIISIF